MWRDQPFHERVLRNICQYDYILHLVFILQIMMLVLALMSHFMVELDDETQAILMVNFVLLGALLITTAGLLRLCHKTRS